MEKEVLELPITGLHMSYGAVKLLYHKPLQKIEQRWKIDHEAYKSADSNLETSLKGYVDEAVTAASNEDIDNLFKE